MRDTTLEEGVKKRSKYRRYVQHRCGPVLVFAAVVGTLPSFPEQILQWLASFSLWNWKLAIG